MSRKLACYLLLVAFTFAFANADDGAANVAPEAAPATGTNQLPGSLPGFDGKLPTREELLQMLDSMTGMSDEEKANLREELLKSIRTDDIGQAGGWNDITMQTVILLSLLGLVALIFVFFVYKLFKCLSARQAKREEKKKSKQLKKKK